MRTRLLAIALYLLPPTLVAGASDSSSLLHRRGRSERGFGAVFGNRRRAARRSLWRLERLERLLSVGGLPLCGVRVVELVGRRLKLIHGRAGEFAGAIRGGAVERTMWILSVAGREQLVIIDQSAASVRGCKQRRLTGGAAVSWLAREPERCWPNSAPGLPLLCPGAGRGPRSADALVQAGCGPGLSEMYLAR